MFESKRLGVMTSGGDCTGLNACIRAIVRRAVETFGWDVIGIREGTQGLMSRPLEYVELDLATADDTLLREGGTILGALNRGDPFAYPMPDGSVQDRSAEIIDGYRQLGLDGLVVIGGDGSLAIMEKLAAAGDFRYVAVPKTIDNDVGSTEYSIGFVTAVNVAVEALDRLAPTAASHDRVMILEVMGRDAGHIALHAGIAGGADVILIPEIPYKMSNIARKLTQIRNQGRDHALVIVAEGVKTEGGAAVTKARGGGGVRYGGIGQYLEHRISKTTGSETRVTVLGHVQRGGTPSMRDRVIGSAFGVYATDLVAEGRFGRMVGWHQRQVVDVPVAEALASYNCVNPDDTLVKTAQALGIYLGDS